MIFIAVPLLPHFTAVFDLFNLFILNFHLNVCAFATGLAQKWVFKIANFKKAQNC